MVIWRRGFTLAKKSAIYEFYQLRLTENGHVIKNIVLLSEVYPVL